MKLTYEFVKGEFEKKGYELLSTNYLKAVAKLDFKCDKGHRHSMSYNDIQSGTRCGKCYGEYKFTYNDVIDTLNKINYELLSPEVDYKNKKSIIKFKCDKGHINEAKFNAIHRGCICSMCTGNKKLTYEIVKEEFAKVKYTLLSTEYVNARTKLDYTCDKGHNNSVVYYSFSNRGSRCPHCSGKAKPTIEFVKSEFEKVGYNLLDTEYKTSHSHLNFICDKLHTTKIAYTHFQQGKRCGHCNIKSYAELNTMEYLQENKISFEYEKKYTECKNLRQLPFDYYLSDYNALIELDGQQHFDQSDNFFSSGLEYVQNHDKIKTKYCYDNKISLLRISYKNKKVNIIKLIQEFINKLKTSKTPVYIFSEPALYKHLIDNK
jgi:hypothetical protein